MSTGAVVPRSTRTSVPTTSTAATSHHGVTLLRHVCTDTDHDQLSSFQEIETCEHVN